MPRIRSVHPDICLSDTMAELPAELERTFVRLWTHCDDEGRCEDRIKLIKAAIYPLIDSLTPEVLNEQLNDLQRRGLILRYSATGTRLIQVTSWTEYQHPQRPKPSKWLPPAETDESATDTGQEHDGADTPHGLEREKEREKERERDIGEGEGEGAARGAVSFDTFWINYPTRNGIKGSKRNARAAWRTLKPEQQDAATGALETYATAADGFPKDAERYLRGHLWEGLDPSQVGIRAGPRDRFAEMGRSLQQRVERVKEGGRNGVGNELDQTRRGLPSG